MTTVQAGLTYYKQVNEQVRSINDSEIAIENAIGQRYLGCGSSGKTIIIHGTPGNGLGQYLNGSSATPAATACAAGASSSRATAATAAAST